VHSEEVRPLVSSIFFTLQARYKRSSLLRRFEKCFRGFLRSSQGKGEVDFLLRKADQSWRPSITKQNDFRTKSRGSHDMLANKAFGPTRVLARGDLTMYFIKAVHYLDQDV
jgi:hypothetical protein